MAKICIISPSLKMGGIERALVTLANHFYHLGHKVDYILCLKGHEFYELEKGIEIHKPNFKRDGSVMNKFLFYPRLLGYIRKKVDTIHPDQVLVYGDLFSPITLLALFNTNHRVFISDRTIPDYKFKWPIRVLKSWLYPKSAGFIAQTTRAADYKRRQFGEKLNIMIIPNALPDLKRKLELEQLKNKKLLYVGRFAWEKDPEILIRSFAIIHKEFPDWKLVMAGDGPLLIKMINLAKELYLNENIEFLGKVTDVANLYQTAGIYIIPSIVEGFPNSLIEAMSFGLPSICFSDIPYEDIIQNNINGVVVFERTYTELAKAVKGLIKNELKANNIGEQAKLKTLDFSTDVVSKLILNFMEIN